MNRKININTLCEDESSVVYTLMNFANRFSHSEQDRLVEARIGFIKNSSLADKALIKANLYEAMEGREEASTQAFKEHLDALSKESEGLYPAFSSHEKSEEIPSEPEDKNESIVSEPKNEPIEKTNEFGGYGYTGNPRQAYEISKENMASLEVPSDFKKDHDELVNIFSKDKLEAHHVKRANEILSKHQLFSPGFDHMRDHFGFFTSVHAPTVLNTTEEHRKGQLMDARELKSFLSKAKEHGRDVKPFSGRVFEDRTDGIKTYHHINKDGTTTQVQKPEPNFIRYREESTHPLMSPKESLNLNNLSNELNATHGKAISNHPHLNSVVKYSMGSADINKGLAIRHLNGEESAKEDVHDYEKNMEHAKHLTKLLSDVGPTHTGKEFNVYTGLSRSTNPRLASHEIKVTKFEPTQEHGKPHEVYSNMIFKNFSRVYDDQIKGILSKHLSSIGQKVPRITSAFEDPSSTEHSKKYVVKTDDGNKEEVHALHVEHPQEPKHSRFKMVFPAFTSTSLDPAVADSFSGAKTKHDPDIGADVADVAHIKIPSGYKHGAHIESHANFGSEKEYLLSPMRKVEFDSKPKYYADQGTIRRVWTNGTLV